MRILIVEDEARIADLIAEVLESEGYIAEIALLLQALLHSTQK